MGKGGGRGRKLHAQPHSFFLHTLAQTSMKYLPKTSRRLKNAFSKPPDFFFVSFPVIQIRVSIRGGEEAGMRWAEKADRFPEDTEDGDNSSLLSGVAFSPSPALLALVSYAELSTATTCVFSEWIWGLEGWQENQEPATQICHRLRNEAQLSERGTHRGDPRVRPPAAGARAPFSASTLHSASARLSALLPLLLPLLPSPAKYGNPPELGCRGSRQPAPSQGSARSALVPPPVRPQPLSPSSGKLTLELPGRARAEGAGGPEARPGIPAPAPSDSPTGSSQAGRALSLCLPRSLARSLRPGYLGGLQDGTAREGSLCAAPRE